MFSYEAILLCIIVSSDKYEEKIGSDNHEISTHAESQNSSSSELSMETRASRPDDEQVEQL